jgi:hypothetical protein
VLDTPANKKANNDKVTYCDTRLCINRYTSIKNQVVCGHSHGGAVHFSIQLDHHFSQNGVVRAILRQKDRTVLDELSG